MVVSGSHYYNKTILTEDIKMTDKKYELTKDQVKVHGAILHRIRALRYFGDVKAGDLGGYIEHEQNLSHDGTAWVYDEAKIFDTAMVEEDAIVSGSACVFGNAKIKDFAQISDFAMVYEEACVLGQAKVYESACVYGNASVSDHAMVSGEALVYENAEIYETAIVTDNASVAGFAKVYAAATVEGYSFVLGCARIHENAHVYDNAKIDDRADVHGKSQVYGVATVKGNAEVSGNCIIAGFVTVLGNAKISGLESFTGSETIDGDPQSISADVAYKVVETVIEDNDQIKFDAVHKPKHYQIIEGLESIDIIACSMTEEQFKGFCLGNILKYRIRAGKKDAVEQDIAKANEYENIFLNKKHLCRKEGYQNDR